MPKSSYNSSVNSSHKIIKSFSMLKQIAKTISEPILLVEGETDEIFYKRLINAVDDRIVVEKMTRNNLDTGYGNT